MKNLYLVLAFIIILIASGCGNNSERSNNSKSTNTQVEETIDGTYTYSDNSVELEITISGDSWYGKTMIVTGYVEVLRKHGMKISMTEEDHVYENALAERVNGILKDEYYLDELNVEYEKAQEIVAETIELYNNYRIHASLNYITPRQYYLNQKKIA